MTFSLPFPSSLLKLSIDSWILPKIVYFSFGWAIFKKNDFILKDILFNQLNLSSSLRTHTNYRSNLFSAFSLLRSLEIGHRLFRPVDECSKEEKGGFWVGKRKKKTARNLMIGERENTKARNTVSCIVLQHLARWTKWYYSLYHISFYTSEERLLRIGHWFHEYRRG